MKNLMIILLFLITTAAFSGPCDRYLIHNDSFPALFAKSFNKELSSDAVKVIKGLDLDGKSDFKEFVDKLSAAGKKKMYKSVNDEPQLFLRNNEAKFSKLFVEYHRPGYAKASYERFQSFQPDSYAYPFKFPKFNNGANPTAVEKNYRLAFEEINNVFKDQKVVFKRMQEFEDEVLARSLKADANFYSLDDRAQAQIKQDSMVDVLNELEEAGGFISTSTTKYKALELEDRFYGLDEWQEMLSEGKIFNDGGFKNVDNPVDLASRNGHGYFTHRIQWHVLMKEMQLDPARFKNFRPVDLYKKLGDTEFARKMGLATGTGDTPWQHLFDSLQGNSYHRPEFYRSQHDLYPFLGAWL